MSTPAELRLHVLHTGTLDCADYGMFRPVLPPGVRRELSVRSYLVVHPRGALLWDTGLPDAFAAQSDGVRLSDDFVGHVPVTLASQLAALGWEPDAIGLLGLSHLHEDHVGNVGLLSRAGILLQQAECDAAFGPEPERCNYVPAAYAALDRDRIVPLRGEHDVFGDGSVTIRHWPGHTPGHQALCVRLPRTGLVVLAGDLAYSTSGFAAKEVPRVHCDGPRAVASMHAAQAQVDEHAATIWFHHDIDQQAGLRLAPEAYA